MTKPDRADVIVIGGGTAGMMAAGEAARTGASVVLLERNDKLGRKLGITGKGRCNITNDCGRDELLANIPRNPRFLFGAFAAFSPQDTKAFFEEMGVPVKTERGKRVFPESDRAGDVVNAMLRFSSGASRATGRATELLLENGAVRGVICDDGATMHAESVIIATGGLSYPVTGSDGDGYALAKQCGHTITELSASLVPLESEDCVCANCSGLGLKNVGVAFYDGEKKLYEDFGELLFTHFGLSGPCVLSGSAHLPAQNSGNWSVVIDLKPALDEKKLDERILREIAAAPNLDISNTCRELLPSTLIPSVLGRAGIARYTKANSLTRDARHALVERIKALKIPISGTRPIEEAVITRGGVSVKEIDPKTMGSRLAEGLYFAGEVMDVDGYTGGFNIQIALSTGRLAGINAARRTEGNYCGKV